MATAPLVTKIVMKNTTKMSLNERFTTYRNQAQTVSNTFRQKIQQQRQATSANLRLAQQMANRPSVQAALRLKKRSLQQRLGGNRQPSTSAASNVKARLNLSRRPNSNIQGRLGTFRGRGGNMRRRGGPFKSGVSPLVKARLGAPRGNFTQNQQGPSRGNFRRRGNFQVGNRQNENRRNQPGNRLPASRNARGGMANRGGGRGGRWSAAGVEAVPTRQELDNQLDAYMAETKGSLDAQLGQYMSQG